MLLKKKVKKKWSEEKWERREKDLEAWQQKKNRSDKDRMEGESDLSK